MQSIQAFHNTRNRSGDVLLIGRKLQIACKDDTRARPCKPSTPSIPYLFCIVQTGKNVLTTIFELCPRVIWLLGRK